MAEANDVLDLLAMYERGDLTLTDLHCKILRLMAHVPPDALLAMLTQEMRADFLRWARHHYDNAVPIDEFISFQPDDNETTDLGIEKIRAWFAQERRAGRHTV